MKIIGIDPGTTTGIALCSWFPPDSEGRTRGFEIDATAEIDGYATVDEMYGEGAHQDDKAWRWCEYYNALECFGWIEEHRPDILVIEDFILQPGKKGEYRGGARAGLSPTRIGGYIGMMIEIAADFNMSIKWQGSSMIAGLNQQRMKHHGIWVVGSEHKRDAVRHCWVASKGGTLGAGGSGRTASVKGTVGGSAQRSSGAKKASPRRVSKSVKRSK